MNKINKENGNYNIEFFIFQIPKLIYSILITSILNIILRSLSLTEMQILSIKSEQSFVIAQKKAKDMKLFIIIKLLIFFIFSFLLMLFFWYFISCFCAVYTNTQIILINHTLISFGFSMLYPFGFYLLPGLLRIPALKAINRDKKCLYKISRLIARIL